MSNPFIAEIRIFTGNFAPSGWAFCDGQLLPIAQNIALFSLFGNIYGGDGFTTLRLPDLQGRAAMHAGFGAGLTPRSLGQSGGADTENLSSAQLPAHNHSVQASLSVATNTDPANNRSLARSIGGYAYQNAAAPNQALEAGSVGSTGGGQAHNNMQPYLSLNFIIALTGLLPSP